ncbi:MAG: 16S rRNA (uracil(1498)-N(3))-methyltransferase [Acinetobacter sp.]|jgi:RsmE family RNA methyltransferase|nr:MAG: 16S rRNA (uracil(1498)-N(3))-methyltransferase [Acinetobacter sp.]
MNIVLLRTLPTGEAWKIDDVRQVVHLVRHVNIQVGDPLKVGILNQARYLTEVICIEPTCIWVKPLIQHAIPAKIPVTLIVALPRPKVLRRLVMDSVTLGVEKLVLLHSYRVDKSYWQSPFLNQLEDYVQLGLEQAGDVFAPDIVLEKRFKPFVEDSLAVWTKDAPTFVGHPYSEHSMPIAWNQPCQLVIGTEGGFIPYEIDLMQKNGCQIMTLGNRILRTETAIAVLLARLFS